MQPDPVRLLYVGELLSIVCEAEGDPKPNITWYKDGISMHFLQSGVTQILVHNVTEMETGRYTCEASNLLGTINATTDVYVESRWLCKSSLADSARNHEFTL